MTDTIHFAHITDVHISERTTSWSTISRLSIRLLEECINHLNSLPDLDFAVVNGDVLDTGSQREVDRFMGIMNGLKKPWHFTPGNHDGFIDPNFPDALLPHEVVQQIDPRMAERGRADAQHGYWSREVAPGVQLIGLDSRLADDWGGRIEPRQFEWLKSELERCHEKLVLLAVHHPLRALEVHNQREPFIRFICSNGPEVESLLDQHPGVKLVMAGHHHANQIREVNGRLLLSTTALSGYPCTYRTVRMTREGEGWRTQISTHSSATQDDLKEAFDVCIADRMAKEYDPDDHTRWAVFCKGRTEDQTFDGML